MIKTTATICIDRQMGLSKLFWRNSKNLYYTEILRVDFSRGIKKHTANERPLARKPRVFHFELF
jgi:hypothetical protein